MKSKLFYSIGILLAANLSVQAATTINILSISAYGFYKTSGGASLAENSLLRYGTFDVSSYNALSTSQKNTYSEVNALFTELGTVSASANGDILSTGNDFSFPTNGINNGDQLYTWVFNVPVATNATEWGIFSSSNALWKVANDPGNSNLSNNNIDQFIAGSAGAGDNVRLTTGVNVPEPGTFALIFGFMALTWVAIRRRK